MNDWRIQIRRFALTLFTFPLALLGGPLIGGVGAVAGGAAVVLVSGSAEAQTVRATSRRTARRTSYRTTARHVTPGPAGVHGTARRTARRTSRRVTRRHLYTMPRGYRVVPIGGYRYYYYGGLYYYPYYVSGKTVYVQVEVNTTKPTPPPPVESVTEEYYVD